MKWFKHEYTSNNAKIEILEDQHGLAGYAVYFKILEIIMSVIEEDNSSEWGYLPKPYTQKYLAKKFGIEEKELEKILATCYELKLLEDKNERIFCSKILERADDYTRRIMRNQPQKQQIPNKIRTNSEQTPEKVRLEEKRIDKNRIEEDQKKIRSEEKESIEKKETHPHKNMVIKKKRQELSSITEEDIGKIAVDYQVPYSFVRSKYDDLKNYCSAHGKVYKNYLAALRNWVKTDSMKLRKEANGISKVAIIPD